MKIQFFRKLLAIAAATTALGSVAVAVGGNLQIGSQRVNYVVVPVTVEEEGEDFLVRNQPKVTERDAATFIRIIREVGEMVSPLLVPEQMKIKLAPIGLNPSANWIGSELNMGVRFGMYDSKNRLYTQNPTIMTSVLAHEFGHMIFGQNITARMPFFPKFVQFIRESRVLAEQIQKIQDEHAAIVKAVEAQGGNATPVQVSRAQELEKVFAILAVRFEAMEKKYEPTLSAFQMTSPYNEFFADIVSVVYTESPNAIAEAIHFAMPNRCYKENGRVCTIQGRNRRRSEIENREFAKVGTSPHYVAGSPHAVFHTVRRWMFEEYFKRPSVLKNKKSEIIVGVARAIAAEMTEVTQMKNLSQQNDVVNVLNKRLAERIRTELGDLN